MHNEQLTNVHADRCINGRERESVHVPPFQLRADARRIAGAEGGGSADWKLRLSQPHKCGDSSVCALVTKNQWRGTPEAR